MATRKRAANTPTDTTKSMDGDSTDPQSRSPVRSLTPASMMDKSNNKHTLTQETDDKLKQNGDEIDSSQNEDGAKPEKRQSSRKPVPRILNNQASDKEKEKEKEKGERKADRLAGKEKMDKPDREEDEKNLKGKIKIQKGPKKKKLITHLTTDEQAAELAASTTQADFGPEDEDDRALSLEEQGASADGEALFCVCRQPYNTARFMIGCDSCEDWFHAVCIGMTVKQAQNLEVYICQECRNKAKGIESSNKDNNDKMHDSNSNGNGTLKSGNGSSKKEGFKDSATSNVKMKIASKTSAMDKLANASTANNNHKTEKISTVSASSLNKDLKVDRRVYDNSVGSSMDRDHSAGNKGELRKGIKLKRKREGDPGSTYGNKTSVNSILNKDRLGIHKDKRFRSDVSVGSVHRESATGRPQREATTRVLDLDTNQRVPRVGGMETRKLKLPLNRTHRDSNGSVAPSVIQAQYLSQFKLLLGEEGEHDYQSDTSDDGECFMSDSSEGETDPDLDRIVHNYMKQKQGLCDNDEHTIEINDNDTKPVPTADVDMTDSALQSSVSFTTPSPIHKPISQDSSSIQNSHSHSSPRTHQPSADDSAANTTADTTTEDQDTTIVDRETDVANTLSTAINNSRHDTENEPQLDHSTTADDKPVTIDQEGDTEMGDSQQNKTTDDSMHADNNTTSTTSEPQSPEQQQDVTTGTDNSDNNNTTSINPEMDATLQATALDLFALASRAEDPLTYSTTAVKKEELQSDAHTGKTVKSKQIKKEKKDSDKETMEDEKPVVSSKSTRTRIPALLSLRHLTFTLNAQMYADEADDYGCSIIHESNYKSPQRCDRKLLLHLEKRKAEVECVLLNLEKRKREYAMGLAYAERESLKLNIYTSVPCIDDSSMFKHLFEHFDAESHNHKTSLLPDRDKSKVRSHVLVCVGCAGHIPARMYARHLNDCSLQASLLNTETYNPTHTNNNNSNNNNNNNNNSFSNSASHSHNSAHDKNNSDKSSADSLPFYCQGLICGCPIYSKPAPDEQEFVLTFCGERKNACSPHMLWESLHRADIEQQYYLHSRRLDMLNNEIECVHSRMQERLQHRVEMRQREELMQVQALEQMRMRAENGVDEVGLGGGVFPAGADPAGAAGYNNAMLLQLQQHSAAQQLMEQQRQQLLEASAQGQYTEEQLQQLQLLHQNQLAEAAAHYQQAAAAAGVILPNAVFYEENAAGVSNADLMSLSEEERAAYLHQQALLARHSQHNMQQYQHQQLLNHLIAQGVPADLAVRQIYAQYAEEGGLSEGDAVALHQHAAQQEQSLAIQQQLLLEQHQHAAATVQARAEAGIPLTETEKAAYELWHREQMYLMHHNQMQEHQQQQQQQQNIDAETDAASASQHALSSLSSEAAMDQYAIAQRNNQILQALQQHQQQQHAQLLQNSLQQAAAASNAGLGAPSQQSPNNLVASHSQHALTQLAHSGFDPALLAQLHQQQQQINQQQ